MQFSFGSVAALAWTAFRTIPLLNREQDLSRVRVPARRRSLGVLSLRRPQFRPGGGLWSVLTPLRGIFRLTSWVSPSPGIGPEIPGFPRRRCRYDDRNDDG